MGSRFEVILEHNNVLESHLICTSPVIQRLGSDGCMVELLFLNDLKLSMEKSNLGIIVFLQMDTFFVIPKISIFSCGLRVGG